MNFKILILISVFSFNEFCNSATLPVNSDSETIIRNTEDKITTDLLEKTNVPTVVGNFEAILEERKLPKDVADEAEKSIESVVPVETEKVVDSLTKEVAATPEVFLAPLKNKVVLLPVAFTRSESESPKSLLEEEPLLISKTVAETIPEVASDVLTQATSSLNLPVDLELPASELKSLPVAVVPLGDALVKNVASIVQEVKSTPEVENSETHESVKKALADSADVVSSFFKEDLRLPVPDLPSPVKTELEEDFVKDKDSGLAAVFTDPLVTLTVPVSAPLASVASPVSLAPTQTLVHPDSSNHSKIDSASELPAPVVQHKPAFLSKLPIVTKVEKLLYLVDSSKSLYRTQEGDLVRLVVVQKQTPVQEENKWVKVADLPYPPTRSIVSDRPKVSHTNFKYTSIPAPRRQLSEAHLSTSLRAAKKIRYNPFVSAFNFRQRMMTLVPEQSIQLPYYEREDDICSYEDTQPGGRCFIFMCTDYYGNTYFC